MKEEEKQALENFIETWRETDAKTKAAFLRLKDHLQTQAGAELSFKARPGVSFSLRAARPEDQRELYVMVDVIDDDPANRWLSVCFYGDMIKDPEEQGDLIPGGLLGEDGYCFDLDEAQEDFLGYLVARLDEAYQSAGT